jgi:hypothetical protein
VRCIGLVPTSFNEANSSLISGTLRRDKDRSWDLNSAMRLSSTRRIDDYAKIVRDAAKEKVRWFDFLYQRR